MLGVKAKMGGFVYLGHQKGGFVYLGDQKGDFEVGMVGQTQARRRIRIGEYNFEIVDNFSYLGSKITTDNNYDDEIRARLLSANRAYFSLQRLFRSKRLTIGSKLLLYKMILPVLMYSSETWVLRKKNCELLATFERRIL